MTEQNDKPLMTRGGGYWETDRYKNAWAGHHCKCHMCGKEILKDKDDNVKKLHNDEFVHSSCYKEGEYKQEYSGDYMICPVCNKTVWTKDGEELEDGSIVHVKCSLGGKTRLEL